MSCHVWPGEKHQLCWWHQHEALQRHLKGNLPTSVYNVWRARCEHGFVDQDFCPYGCMDPNNSKGYVSKEIYDEQAYNADMTLTSNDPNSIKICVPILTSQSTQQSMQQKRLTICIPASNDHAMEPEDKPDDSTAYGQHTFCPVKNCDLIVKLMKHHFCMHPLIPGYSAPTPEGIKSWTVKQMYEYCVHHDLANLLYGLTFGRIGINVSDGNCGHIVEIWMKYHT